MASSALYYPLAHGMVEIVSLELRCCMALVIERSIGGVNEQRCSGKQLLSMKQRIGASEGVNIHLCPDI